MNLLARAAALCLLLLGTLPVANWIAGGHDIPWYAAQVGEWGTGLALVAGTGLLLALLSRRLGWLWRPGWFAPVGAAAARHPWRTVALLGGAAFVGYAAIAQLVFDARPLLIDEIIQVWQARVLAGGRLWVPVPDYPEFTSAMHLVDHDGRRFGQFPIGGPAMLALGALLRAEWLVGPLFGAIAVMTAWSLYRRIEPEPGVALAAVILLATAPFAGFLASSHMNHVMAMAWLLVGVTGLARVTVAPEAGWSAGLATGIGFGVAATIRPVDALAFALPAGAWLLWRALCRREGGVLVAAGIGVALPVGLLLAVNAATTGHPLLFAYTVMWGSAHDLGFHATPWGEVHSPARGLELVNLYLVRLQVYLFEAPVPSLLPATLALALARRLAPMDRYLLVASALLLGLYFAYWHDGFFLGPRFVLPLAPILALWTARAVPLLRDRLGSGFAFRICCYGILAAAPLAAWQVMAVRAPQYRSGLLTMRFDADRAAQAAGVRDATILVRESWGAEVMVRLWAVGVGRGEAEQLYRRIDTCLLDLALRRVESAGLRGEAARAEIAPLLADSARVLSSTLSPDFTERMLPGASYPPRCQARLASDAEGFTLFAPFLLAGRDGNRFVRDLRERNTLLGGDLAGRPVYLLQPRGSEIGAPLVFRPLDADSLLNQPIGPP